MESFSIDSVSKLLYLLYIHAHTVMKLLRMICSFETASHSASLTNIAFTETYFYNSITKFPRTLLRGTKFLGIVWYVSHKWKFYSLWAIVELFQMFPLRFRLFSSLDVYLFQACRQVLICDANKLHFTESKYVSFHLDIMHSRGEQSLQNFYRKPWRD
jgi:hypothetical protein